MANTEADTLYSDQWEKMVNGGPKWQGWGEPEPTRQQLNGKTREDLLNWASACKVKVAYWIGRIPEDQSRNDGFDEVRATWFQKRALALEEAAGTITEEPVRKRLTSSGIRPMIPQERLPFGARPAFITKKRRQEEDDADGTGDPSEEGPSVPAPSPTVMKPFRPPRKVQKTDIGSAETVPSVASQDMSPSSPPDPPMRWLAEVDLKCTEVISDDEETQLPEQQEDSEEE